MMNSYGKGYEQAHEENYRALVFAEFAERLVKEYRDHLADYIGRCRKYVDEYNVPGITLDSVYYYWRNELTTAEAQLSLSDVELMPLIKSEPPFHLAG